MIIDRSTDRSTKHPWPTAIATLHRCRERRQKRKDDASVSDRSYRLTTPSKALVRSAPRRIVVFLNHRLVSPAAAPHLGPNTHENLSPIHERSLCFLPRPTVGRSISGVVASVPPSSPRGGPCQRARTIDNATECSRCGKADGGSDCPQCLRGPGRPGQQLRCAQFHLSHAV